MATLSIFIDESGDFGPVQPHSPYYLLTLVFHNQDEDISSLIQSIGEQVSYVGFPRSHVLHSGPLIRRENDYRDVELDVRRRLFKRLYEFTRLSPIHYRTFCFDKRHAPNHDALVARMAREVGSFVRDHLNYFQSFESIVVYYDNGQKEITTIINSVFNSLIEADIRRAFPVDYRLFQAADLLCTLELLRIKVETGTLTRTETTFFGGTNRLRKNYLKQTRSKLLT